MEDRVHEYNNNLITLPVETVERILRLISEVKKWSTVDSDLLSSDELQAIVL